MKYLLMPPFFLLLLLVGCHTKPKEFTLVFTMESLQNYKMSIEIEKDKSYQLHQQNMFFGTREEKEQIHTSQGKMTDEDYNRLSELIAGSHLFKMKDAYGFDQEADFNNPFDDMIYQITYTEGQNTKYISIRLNTTERFSDTFVQLLRFLSNYMSDNR